MGNKNNLEEYSIEELRQLIIEKKMAQRKARIDHFQRSGRVVPVPPAGNSSLQISPEDSSSRPALRESRRNPRGRKKRGYDSLLLLVEIIAAISLVVILLTGYNVLRDLNQEVSTALQQPTLTPTALIYAVVLPSGHTPPGAPGGVRPNEAEIPAHLAPIVQTLANLPIPTPGPKQAIRIQIPSIDVDAPVVQGDGWEQLKKGVGQTIGTPHPGEDGNIVLSAHNDVFGEIFRDLDQLNPGDTVTLFNNQRAYTYAVRDIQIVEPTRVEVMAPTREPVITLISCYPYLVSDKRIVVRAELVQ